MLNLIKRFAGLYLVEMLGFCLMGNHFHLLVRVFPEHHFSDEEIKQRYTQFYGETCALSEGQIPALRIKLSSLSEFMREIKHYLPVPISRVQRCPKLTVKKQRKYALGMPQPPAMRCSKINYYVSSE